MRAAETRIIGDRGRTQMCEQVLKNRVVSPGRITRICSIHTAHTSSSLYTAVHPSTSSTCLDISSSRLWTARPSAQRFVKPHATITWYSHLKPTFTVMRLTSCMSGSLAMACPTFPVHTVTRSGVLSEKTAGACV